MLKSRVLIASTIAFVGFVFSACGDPEDKVIEDASGDAVLELDGDAHDGVIRDALTPDDALDGVDGGPLDTTSDSSAEVDGSDAQPISACPRPVTTGGKVCAGSFVVMSEANLREISDCARITGNLDIQLLGLSSVTIQSLVEVESISIKGPGEITFPSLTRINEEISTTYPALAMVNAPRLM